MNLDTQLLFAPLRTLSARGRALAIALATLLTLGWCLLRNLSFPAIWALPDVAFYVDMAGKRFDLVPAPFSNRPLAPLLARWIAAATGGSLHTGFTVLGFASVVWTLLVVFWLISRSAAPRWALLAVAAAPFWPELLRSLGLPDPFYTGLLATLLLSLETDQLTLAAALMFPLMLARESTWLTLFCLLLVAGRRLGLLRAALATALCAAATVLVHHLSAGSLPNPEHLSGGLYMVGKMVSNGARSVGIAPWSNVYPALCPVPRWQLPVHLGPVHSVGICHFDTESPFELASAVLIVFGVLPVALLAVPLRRRLAHVLDLDRCTRFCLLYGGISFLIAPVLGTWYTRLLGYGWPLFLVAVPLLLAPAAVQAGRGDAEMHPRALWGGLLVVQVLGCALGQTQVTPATLVVMVAAYGLWFALFLVQRRQAQ